MRILGKQWKLILFHLKQLGILLDHFGIVAPGRDKNIEVRDLYLKLKTAPGRTQLSNRFLQPFDENRVCNLFHEWKHWQLLSTKGFRQAVNSSIAFKKTSSKGRKRVDYLLQSFTAWNTSCTFSMCYGIASWRALDGYLVQLLPKLIRVRTAKDWTTGRDTRLSDI